MESIKWEDDGIVHLEKGYPAKNILRKAVQIISDATQHRMTREQQDASAFAYGPDEGNEDYLEQLSKFLTRNYGSSVHKANLLLTCGSTHGLSIILNALFVPHNAVVFVEDPSYFLALQMFQHDFQMKVVPIPLTPNGIDVESLRTRIIENTHLSNEEKRGNKPYWAMVYTIPMFQNPTGMVMNDATSRSLIEVCRQHNVLIVCDDVYNLLYYDDLDVCPYSRLFAMDNPSDKDYIGNVLSNGTFSKILAPGIRVGWIEGPTQLIKKITETVIIHGGGSVNNVMSSIVASAMETGSQDTLLRSIRFELKMKMDGVYEILRLSLPLECIFPIPTGGYYMWLKLPQSVNSQEFQTFLKSNYKVNILPGSLCSISPDSSSRNYIRICTAFYDLEILKVAMTKICAAIKSYTKSV